MNKKRILIISLIVLLVVGYFYFSKSEDSESLTPVSIVATKGDFLVSVVTTGELESKNSAEIYGPTNLRKMGINNIKVSDMVDEGTLLKEGDYVATLDPSEIGTEIRKLYSDLTQKQSDLKAAKLDTSLTMRNERETLLNLKVELEQNKLELEQSKYEPPATQRKVEIQLEKTLRNFTQAKSNILLKEQQAVAKVFKVQTDVELLQDKVARMEELIASLRITAPQNGMLVYHESWNGKIKAGSSISAWDPVVAKIPDLSKMVSKTYVNEIDISKIKKSQKVKIKIDAFPDLSLDGEVVSVANIGQIEVGGDAKVFEVMVKVLEMDSVLKPSMTTSNEIMIETFKDVVSIPIEGLFTTDSLTFIYKEVQGDIIKQEIEAGISNATSIVIEKGLSEGEKVYLIPPVEAGNIELKKID